MRSLLVAVMGFSALWAGALCSVVPAAAAPFVPTDDALVLERLPERTDPAARELKRLRATLAQQPDDIALAARFARRAIEAAREAGDPRFLGQAQAALAPWWNLPDPPPSALLLRATIKQSIHDFSGALADLDQLLASHPNDYQALLTRATVLTVQGHYAQARADCGQITRSGLALVTTICAAAPASLSGEAERAERALTAALVREPNADPGVREWALTLAAEIAQRRGDVPTAAARFKVALALDPRDPYLLAAYADFLIENDRAAEVLPLLAESTRNDTLLLRLTLAEAKVADAREAFAAHSADLAARFAAARRRNDVLHQREEARYMLEVAGDASAALALARANWQVQKEPADLHILLASALAMRDAAALKQVTEWVLACKLEDVAVTKVLRSQG